MASYNRHGAELRARFVAIRETIALSEVATIDTGLNALDSVWYNALNELAFAAGDEGDDLMKSKVDGLIVSGKQNVANAITNLLRGITTPTLPALAFVNQANVESTRFFEGLAALNLGAARDALQTTAENIEWELKALDVKWSELSDQDNAILAAELEAWKKANDVVKNAIAKGTSLKADALKRIVDINQRIRDIPKTVGEIAKATFQADGLPEDLAKFLAAEMGKPGKSVIDTMEVQGVPAGDTAKGLVFHVGDADYRIMDVGAWTGDALKVAVKGAIQAAAQRAGLDPQLAGDCFTALGYVSDWIKDAATTLMGPYVEQVKAVKSLMPGQGAVVTVFSNCRREAFDFMQRNDPAIALKQFSDIKDGLSRWSTSSSLPPGTQGDAAEFAGNVVTGLNNRMSKLDAEYQQLFNNFKPIFLGTKIDPDVEEKLMQTRSWNDLQSGIIGLRLPDVLADWSNAVLTVRPMLADALTQLQNDLLGLPMDIVSNLKGQVAKLQTDIASKLDSIASDAARQLEECKKAVSDDQVKQDFSRQPMLDALRGSER
jgi:hypothetical protein